jgi:hypothetical protein
MSPTVSASDKSFHTDAILRGYPRLAHIPFERKDAPARDPREHEGQVFADTARHLMAHWSPKPALLNRAYVWPRMQWGLVNRRYREGSRWLPNMALYLFQLDALARGCHAEADAA